MVANFIPPNMKQNYFLIIIQFFQACRSLGVGLLFVLVMSGSLSAQTGVKARNADPASFHVYPNPGAGVFNVQVKEQDKNFDINVYNLVGQMIFHWESSSGAAATVEINLSKQPKGVYFVELDTEKASLLKKIILDNSREN